MKLCCFVFAIGALNTFEQCYSRRFHVAESGGKLRKIHSSTVSSFDVLMSSSCFRFRKYLIPFFFIFF